jgi:hypothetical protein
MSFAIPKSCGLTTAAMLVASTISPAVGNTAIKTVSIESLSQISQNNPSKTLFLFDLDDTIFDSSFMLGSKAWRRYIVEATKKIDPSENWHDIFSYSLASRKYPLKAVEEMTSSFVKGLQNQGFVVCGLTSRQRQIWYAMPQDGIDVLTEKQLSSVGVDFNNKSLENIYSDLSTDSGYYNGTFFAHIKPKGDYILHLFKTASHRPEKVIFVDDKPSEGESVANALTQLGIAHECYLYSATDKKGKAFNPLIANIQLYYFFESDGQRIVSDEEAAEIAKSDPKKDADYYLSRAIEIARKQ